ncbi:MAG TPA: M23 family metallopeptidase [Rhodothermales bacterium]
MIFRFLWRLLRQSGKKITVLIIPEDRLQEPRQYHVRPAYVRVALLTTFALSAAAAVVIVVFTPVADWVRGRDMNQMREEAITNAVRIDQLEDSLDVQREYAALLGSLVGVEPDPEIGAESPFPQTGLSTESGPLHAPMSPDWADHEQPALSLERMPAVAVSTPSLVVVARSYLSGLQLPFRPPAEGFVTRRFDLRTGHFAVDIAVEAGTIVQSVGDGHVVIADWGYDGGWTIGVQHSDGYVTVYKHNDRLLKRVGERVLDREPVAISGNSGEITSGPHIHFELWHEGLAQDPERYFLH